MRRKLSQTVFSCALMAVSVGCGQAGQENSESKIYGGTKVPAGEWQTTVALSQGGSFFCSGTAISPTVIITAAHCTRGVSASSLTIYTGDGKEGGYVRGQHAASKVVSSPKYTGSKGNDIGFVVLKTPLTLPESAFIPVLTDAEEKAELLAVGANAHIVGFGTRNGNGFGVKYEVDTKVVKNISTSMSYDAKTEIAIGGSGKDSCQGDSGGPVYGQLANGDWRVYGITSRGGSCGTGGIYGLMHANICWVQESSGVDLGLPAGTCGDVVAPTTPGDSDDDNNVVVVPTAPEQPAQCNWWEGCWGV